MRRRKLTTANMRVSKSDTGVHSDVTSRWFSLPRRYSTCAIDGSNRSGPSAARCRRSATGGVLRAPVTGSPTYSASTPRRLWRTIAVISLRARCRGRARGAGTPCGTSSVLDRRVQRAVHRDLAHDRRSRARSRAAAARARTAALVGRRVHPDEAVALARREGRRAALPCRRLRAQSPAPACSVPRRRTASRGTDTRSAPGFTTCPSDSGTLRCGQRSSTTAA